MFWRTKDLLFITKFSVESLVSLNVNKKFLRCVLKNSILLRISWHLEQRWQTRRYLVQMRRDETARFENHAIHFHHKMFKNNKTRTRYAKGWRNLVSSHKTKWRQLLACHHWSRAMSYRTLWAISLSRSNLLALPSEDAWFRYTPTDDQIGEVLLKYSRYSTK